jgi:hypothetical protein
VTHLRPISPWLLLLAVVVIVAVTWPLTAWLYGIAGNDPARQIEAIKTGLTASKVEASSSRIKENRSDSEAGTSGT